MTGETVQGLTVPIVVSGTGSGDDSSPVNCGWPVSSNSAWKEKDMAHTPKPYMVSRDAVPMGHTQSTIYSEITGDRVATVFQSEANVRLFTAAPEMLEALEEAERVIRWAAQEAKGKVNKDQVGGWLHHANKLRELTRSVREE